MNNNNLYIPKLTKWVAEKLNIRYHIETVATPNPEFMMSPFFYDFLTLSYTTPPIGTLTDIVTLDNNGDPMFAEVIHDLHELDLLLEYKFQWSIETVGVVNILAPGEIIDYARILVARSHFNGALRPIRGYFADVGLALSLKLFHPDVIKSMRGHYYRNIQSRCFVLVNESHLRSMNKDGKRNAIHVNFYHHPTGGHGDPNYFPSALEEPYVLFLPDDSTIWVLLSIIDEMAFTGQYIITKELLQAYSPLISWCNGGTGLQLSLISAPDETSIKLGYIYD